MLGGLAEFSRNLGLIAFGSAFLEPLLTGEPSNPVNASVAGLWGLAFVAISVILDHERLD